MTYPETIEFLYGIRLFGQKLGLETMNELLRRLGNPHHDLRFIHVAGTNGKGSVAAMTHAVLTHAAYKTGLYTSPHLVSFCERFQINGTPITETDVVRHVELLRPVLDQTTGRPPTFFEVVTAMALNYFREQRVDVVVWETGLGGRLDATNVVTPLVSVITNIAHDHMQYLGHTLHEIAEEKSGIIKPGVPVVTASRDEEALSVIRRVCAQHGCALTEVTGPLDYDVPLLGDHQRWNAATAVAALQASGLRVTPSQLRGGLRHTRWPGRFQIVSRHPVVVLDGAHNSAAAETLAVTLRQQFGSRRFTLIVGVLRDKNYDQMCGILAPLADRIYCVPVNSERTSDPAELARWCRQANPAAEVIVSGSLVEAYERAITRREDVILITGSLFLVGEAFARLPFPAMKMPAYERELVLQ